ncbi:hypothetical protein TL16_g07733 [Triparma laevis f. inornata]|uniref:Uncharacterized protein n=1 Tax=Triparma laevis f. inornata TaxID=1714386 RepID=A0A9W7AUU1_9STRA|nr:hypothetical protein TL16_g07733 [Triparma laevis f. inornata]
MATPTQGLIKMAKGRAALANVLGNENSGQVLALTPKKTGKGTWEQKALSVRTWMKSNPLKLGIPVDGTLETIQQQLTRGDKHQGARQKCWDHILLELASCGVEGLGGVELHTKRITTEGRENANPRLEVDDTNPASSPSDSEQQEKEEEAPNSSGSNSSVGGAGSKAVFALRASAESLANVMAAEMNVENVEKEKEDHQEEVVGVVSGSDLLRLSVEVPALSNQTLEHIKQNVGNMIAPQSKSARPAALDHGVGGVASMESLSARGAGKISSFKEMDQKDTMAKAKEEGDAPADPLTKQPNKPLTMMERQELWMAKKKAKTDAKKAAAEKALVNSISSHPDTGKSKKSLTLVRAKAEAEKVALQKIAKDQAAIKEQVKKAKEEKKEDTNTKGGSKWSLVEKKVTEEKKGEEGGEPQEEVVEAVIFSPTTAMAKRRNSCSDVEAFPVEKGGVTESSSTPNLKEGEKTEARDSSFVPGSFFSRVDDSTRRGHFRVRDGCGFAMSSMYRKRDKYSKQGSAVALLVGTEEMGFEEKVIEVLFDTEKLGEKEAYEWWQENESRFKSPQKKKEE